MFKEMALTDVEPKYSVPVYRRSCANRCFVGQRKSIYVSVRSSQIKRISVNRCSLIVMDSDSYSSKISLTDVGLKYDSCSSMCISLGIWDSGSMDGTVDLWDSGC